MIDQQLSPVLLALEPYAGQYSSAALSLSIRPLGYGCGCEVVWNWASRMVDIGLIGVLPQGEVGLYIVCNSQPWYGQAALREFRLAEQRQTATGLVLAFQTWIPEEPSAERLLLDLREDGSLTFGFQREGSPPFEKKWEMRRVTTK